MTNVAMQELFYNSANIRPNLRKAADFVVPRVNTVHKGDDSLRHLGPLIWEIVPEALKALSIKKFKEEVKKWKPAKCPCTMQVMQALYTRCWIFIMIYLFIYLFIFFLICLWIYSLNLVSLFFILFLKQFNQWV